MTISSEQVTLRRARTDDVTNLVELLNHCYRRADGWTHEADLIGGIRTTADEITAMLNNDNMYMFVLPDPNQTTTLLGCISVDFAPIADKPAAYIGTFAVLPSVQGQGVGHIMLQAVETFISRHAKARGLTHYSMSILSHRPELLAYYQRRGYKLTGEKMPFPLDGNNGEPKRDDLFLEFLQKPISNEIAD